MTVNSVIIDSGNGLLPGQHQAIYWTFADSVDWTLWNKLQGNFNQFQPQIFIHEKAFVNDVWEILVIFFQMC